MRIGGVESWGEGGTLDGLMQMVVSLGFMTTVAMPHCAAHSATPGAAAIQQGGREE